MLSSMERDGRLFSRDIVEGVSTGRPQLILYGTDLRFKVGYKKYRLKSGHSQKTTQLKRHDHVSI